MCVIVLVVVVLHTLLCSTRGTGSSRTAIVLHLHLYGAVVASANGRDVESNEIYLRPLLPDTPILRPVFADELPMHQHGSRNRLPGSGLAMSRNRILRGLPRGNPACVIPQRRCS